MSWVLLRGHCRHCDASISPRYPLVELGCGALFAGTAALFGWEWDLPAYLVLFAGLLALSCIDVERLILPKRIVYPLTFLVAALLLVAAGEMDRWHDYLIGIICAAVWFAVFFALNRASPRLLGFGDVRLSVVLGISLGWLGAGYALLGFFAANLIGAVVGVTLILMKKADRQSRIPYGVFLSAGCAVAVFAGPELLRPFTHYSI